MTVFDLEGGADSVAIARRAGSWAIERVGVACRQPLHAHPTSEKRLSARNESHSSSTALDSVLHRHEGLILFALLIAGLGIAWQHRFVQDDAFISFNYARQLVTGHGLTWFGEHVEGYTNLLWVIWIAAGLEVGIDPVTWSWLGGLAAFSATLVLTWRLGIRCLGRRVPTLLAVVVLIINYSFTAYATGGLETMAQTALLTAAALVAVELRDRPAPGRYALWSLLSAAALLTRLDSIVVLAVAPTIWIRHRRRPQLSELVAATPAVLVIGAWLAWKVAFYGSILPNTYFTKVGSEPLGTNGFVYVGRFLHWYALWPFATLGLVAAAHRRSGESELLVGWVLLWTLYVVWVGGDFMEFRLLVPVLPPIALLVALGLHDVIGGWVRRPLLVSVIGLTLLTVASARHAGGFKTWTRDHSIDSIPALGTFYGLYRDGDWTRLGLALRRQFAGIEVLLAMHAVGAIPYYSQIPTIDMWGLNDKFVARHGNPVPPDFRRPGHRRQAPLAYLRKRGVNFVLGDPQLVARGSLSRLPGATLSVFIREAIRFEPRGVGEQTLVEIPIDDEHSILAIYLTASPVLDRLIRERGWQRTRAGDLAS